MKQNDHDTIFASSIQFRSAIKIIIISGKNAKKISSIFNFKRPAPRTFALRKLTHKNDVIDHAPVIWLPKGKSFTGEDTFEIYIHGSVVIEKWIYKILSSYKNFRLAEPGEFTKRATLNGNIDLVQAESINEIIYTNKPSILIPFPFAVDNHQFHNANFLKQNSCAEIIKDSDLTADLILRGLLGFYNNPDKVDMIKNKLKGLTHKNTSERMLNYIQDSNVTQ